MFKNNKPTFNAALYDGKSGVMKRLYERKRLKGRLFKNVHTGELCIVRFVRAYHIYYACDGCLGRMYASAFCSCWERVA